MTKDKKVTASKDKSFQNMVMQSMDQMNNKAAATLFENGKKENTAEGTTLEIKMDYKKAYELALVTMVELEEAMKNVAPDQQQVHEIFTIKFEELQDLVKMLCVDFEYK